MQSASAIYRAAAGLTPAATGTVTEESHCVMCGAPLAVGTPASPLTKGTFNQAFNNTLDLRAISGKYVCGDCEVLWCKDWMQRYSKTFATSAGVYKFASNEHQAGFFLNPPEAPFVAIFSTKQQQHMIWRTPVSLSRDYYTVRVDSELLTIRTAVLLEALAAYRAVESIMETTKLGRTGRTLKPPAALFSRELASSKMGHLRRDVSELLTENDRSDLLVPFQRLSMGEWWALNVCRHYDPASPPPHENALLAA